MDISSPRVRRLALLALPVVLVFSLILTFSLATSLPARAQPASGEIGIYLNPEGTANYISPCGPGQDCGQEYYWQDDYGRDGFTAYVVAKDLSADVERFNLGLEISGYSLIVPHFPEGTNYAFSPGVTGPDGTQQVKFEVEPPDCISSVGLFVLGSFDVVVANSPGFFFFVRLTTNDLISGTVGYFVCSSSDVRLHRWTIADGGKEVGIFYPDPVPESTMGMLKSWY